MAPEEIAAVNASFARVYPHKGKLARDFLEELFRVAPHLRPLFRSDLGHTFDRVVAILASIVRSLGTGRDIREIIVPLAGRHTFRGTEPAHFVVVGDALLSALAMNSPGGLPKDEHAAWAKAYGVISEIMITEIARHEEAAQRDNV